MAKTPTNREAVIMSILINGEKYGREIRQEYERRVGQGMPIGSLYTTLDRMEDVRFVTTHMGRSGSKRGGNRRKYYRLTGQGLAALDKLTIALGLASG